MDVGVELAGQQQLVDRLDRAHDGVLNLSGELEGELLAATPPTLVFASPSMRPRTWGPDDLWTLPAGGWLAPTVKLPDPMPELEQHVQQLLD